MSDAHTNTPTFGGRPGEEETIQAGNGGPIASPEPSAGRGTALGRYVILDTLGQGGMGVVYSAYDPQLDRRIAIKLLRHTHSEEGNARLLREARAMARLNHRNVATVHDVGTVNGSVFVAMEFVEGETMKHWINNSAGTDRSVEKVLALYLDAGEGLAAAHDAGLIHRDFKPENVMLTPQGRVVVLDFGLAAPPADSATGGAHAFEHNDLTLTGTIMGTPAYMSPEQITGSPVGPASDQFSFCVALYEGLFGARPYAGNSLDDLRGQLTSGERSAPPPDHDVPGWILQSLERGLQRHPKDRHRSMRELLAALRADPAKKRRRIVVPTLTILGLGGLGAIGLIADPPTAKPCADADGGMRRTYGDEQRASIRNAFDALATPTAADTANRVILNLDRYANDWSKLRIAACEANEVSHEETDELYGRRLICLDERLYALDAHVSRLGSLDAAAAQRVVIDTAELPPVDLCRDDEYLRADVRPPTDPKVADEVQRLRREITANERRSSFRRAREIRDQAAAIVDQARESGYQPVVAEALLSQGVIEHSHDDTEHAAEILMDAMLTGERSRHDRFIFKSLVKLAQIASEKDDHELAGSRLARAEAVLYRLGAPNALRLELLRNRARHGMAIGQFVEARRDVEEALEIRKEDGSYERIGVLVDATLYSQLSVQLGEVDSALETAAHARDVAIRELGASHPFLGQLTMVAGTMALAAGDTQQALEYYADAEARFIRDGEREQNRAILAGQTGLAHILSGQFEQGQLALERAVELSTRAMGPEHSTTITFRSNLAELYVAQGKLDIACPMLEKLLEVTTTALGANSEAARNVLGHLGGCRLAEGDREGARDLFARARASEIDDSGVLLGLVGQVALDVEDGRAEEALAAARRAMKIPLGNDVSGYGARARFALAKALAANGRLDDARREAESAAEELAALKATPAVLAKVRAWLDRHPEQ